MHDSSKVSQQGLCDFCGVPIPNDNRNLSYAKRTVAILESGEWYEINDAGV